MRYLIIILLVVSGQLSAQDAFKPANQPVELGYVHWLRNYDQAIEQSKEKGLPVLILFQEVPGCSTCTKYGHDILKHPFIVELIETHFVPLAIYNNKGGQDREILKKFREPSWNNPVVRIIGQNEKDLVSRLAGDYSHLGLVESIKQAMFLSNQTVPNFLETYIAELRGEGFEQEAFLSMFCFWTGEKEIAGFDGVLATEAGFMHGREVVRVTYDETKTDLKTIAKQAEAVQCADRVFSDASEHADRKPGKFRADREVKYYLSRSKYRSIPMTPLQSAKVNAALGKREDVSELLSPRQLQLAKQLNGSKINNIGKDFGESWYDIVSE